METTQEIEIFTPEQTGVLFWANLTATEDVVVNQGGSFAGKTHAILQVLFVYAITNPDWVITVITNTITKLKEDALRITKSIINQSPAIRNEMLEGQQSYNQSDRVYYFKNGSIIEFKSFEDEEQAKGGKRHILFVNEASRIRWKVFFEAELRTTVRTFVDYNPTSQFYIHDKVVNNSLEYPSVKVIRSWHVHNPFLDQKQRDRLERIQDREMWKVYARGLTGILTGTVYHGWTEVDDFTWSDGVHWYLDWGYTNDPTAGGRIAVAPKGTDFDYVVDEICYSPGIPMGTLAQLMKDKGYKEGQICYCDHDIAQITEIKQFGIAAFPVIKGEGSVLSGILFIKNKRMAYTKRSENIAMELKRYKFLEIDDKITNVPIDQFNHHMDLIRGSCYTYALQSGQV